jgi:DnaK suppressor protein
MRKMKKFSEGGKTSRAQGKMDRRMADIEKDFQRALAKGKSEKEARAKRAQREADARDDYAKRTGGDRTETRAAEKAAEARLKAARRSPDKDMKPVSVASTPSAMTKIDTPKVETSAVGKKGYDDMSFRAAFAQAMKDKGKGETFTWKGKSYKLETAGAAPKKAAAPAPAPAKKETPRYGASFGAPTVKPKAEDKSVGRRMAETSARRQNAQVGQLGRELSGIGSAIAAPFRRIRAAGEADDRARGVGKAKGGKINEGKRGMAKLPSKNYLAERLRKAAEGPENRSAESLQRGAIGRANREQARETQDRKAKRPMAKGGKVMKHASKAGNAMKKKSADTMGRAMVKKYAKGGSIDGCATKGKTKTKMVKMAMGGMTGYKRGGKTC